MDWWYGEGTAEGIPLLFLSLFFEGSTGGEQGLGHSTTKTLIVALAQPRCLFMVLAGL